MGRELATNEKKTSELETYLRNNAADLANVYPKNKDRMLNVLVQMVYRNPELAKCDRNSIIVAACQAGALGLDFNPTLGECYLIPRWNKNINGMECTFMPGYQGLVKLVRRTSQVLNIRAAIVYEDDEFEIKYTPDLSFDHVPALKQSGAVRNGKGVKGVYAVAKLNNGEYQIEYMTVGEIEEVRSVSVAKDKGPWVAFWGEMAKKTVLRRLIKSLPKNSDSSFDALTAALEANDAEYDYAQPRQIENHTGYGSGQYADPEKTKEYIQEIEKYLAKRNGEWEQRWVNPDTGEIPEGVKPLSATWTADKVVLSMCIANGYLDPSISPEALKNRQIGRYTAIAWGKSAAVRNKIRATLRDFLDQREREETAAIEAANPHLFPELETDRSLADDDFSDMEGVTDIELAPKEPVTPLPPKPAALTSAKPGKKTAQATLPDDDADSESDGDSDVWRKGRE